MKLKFSSKTVSTGISFLLSIVLGLLAVEIIGEGTEEEAISFEEYVENTSQNQEWADVSETEENISEAVSEEVVLTFDQIIESVNSSYDCTGKITENPFSDETGIKIEKISFLDNYTPENVSYALGYIFAGDRIFDKFGNDLTEILSGYNFIGCRDLDGNALFEKNGGYYFLNNGSIEKSDNNRFIANETKYFLNSEGEGYFFNSGGKWGLKNSEGKIVVSASFTYAYGISEGFAIFATKEKNLYLYNMDGDKISAEYFMADMGKGSGFIRNGITLASNGKKNIILKSSGAILDTPSDYSVFGCSDGMIRLNKNGKSGYMNANGVWVVYPEYSYASDFCEGLAVVSKGSLEVINKNGETVVPAAFDQIYDFADGVTFAFSTDNGWYMIQKQLAR